MTPCDLMIRGGDVLDPETPGSSLADHSVVIVDDHIVDVAPRSEAGER